MKKFYIYDTRHYEVMAETDEEAVDIFLEMDLNETMACEIDGGSIEVQEA